MKEKIKNYTSSVPADRSISLIEKKLVEMGAKNINKEYQSGELVGIKFLIDINAKTVYFELPAKVDRVFEILWKEVKRPHPGTRKLIREQAERTAWKLVYDWILCQATMIQMEQADVLQVLLPYALVNGNTTVYQAIQNSGLKMLSQ